MSKSVRDEISVRVARIHAGILAVVMGLICGIALFVMTLWLVIKGGPNPGPHLQLLGQYFAGYSVTLGGAFVGLIYGLVVGGAWGWLIGLIYNRVVAFRGKKP